jgi:anthranilate phosphoribosyltransferase
VTTPDANSAALRHIHTGGTLDEHQSFGLFDAVFAGRLADADVFDLLKTLAHRGPTIDELVGAARAMRRHLKPVDLGFPPTFPSTPILDTCGTGGAPKLFNVSTIGAIVTAAAANRRVLVAKHGNRSRTGRGSAEVLEALGVNIHATPEAQARSLRDVGICFSFAPDHHPGARHAAAARKALGTPTIFNLLGPLSNPAGATRQLIGTYSHHNANLLAQALARLGAANGHAMVVTSLDGLDELTTTASNRVFTVQNGQVTPTAFNASSLGFASATIADLQADSLDHATRIARQVLAGQPGPTTDIVMLNAAASLLVGGVATDMAEGCLLARHALESGAAARTLDAWVRASHS